MKAQTVVLLLEYAIRSTVLLGLAGLAALALRRRSAAARHWVWAVALAGLVLLPLIGNWTPRWEWSAKPDSALAAPWRTVMEVTAAAPASGRSPVDLARWLWLTGAALALLRFGYGQFGAHRLAREARAVPGQTRYRVHDRVQIPVVCGLFRPVVILPAGAEQWSADRLAHVLAHEEMHVARRDTLTQALAQLACAWYWPQPLVWLAASELRRECEQAADDGVLAMGTKASAYAGHLVEIARALNKGGAQYEGGIAMAHTTQLERRVSALLHPSRDRRKAGRRFAAAVAGLALLLLVCLAAVRTPLLAQLGRLSGTVRDASGAVVPKARVDVSNKPAAQEAAFREIVYTNEAGEFTLDNVPDGALDISVAKPGFARLQLTGMAFQAGKTRPLDLTLNIGAISETLQVQGTRTGPPAGGAPGGGGIPQRINVGGNVQQANLIAQAKPSYPPGCKAEGVEGTVVFKAIIGKDGSIMSLEQVNKQVDARLADAAREAVQQWRYRPTLLNGNPVEVVTTIEINFTLAQ